MPLKKFESTKPYVTIIGGRLAQKVDENTPGAELRKYELKDGTKGEKWEVYYQSIEGQIKDLHVKDGEYGQSVEVVFPDCILSLNTESRYFQDFAKKIKSADLKEIITLTPYDFEPEGKRKTGVVIYQNGEKLQNFYWDDKNEKPSKDFPQVPKKEMDTDDWKVYFIEVKKFLVEELLELNKKVDHSVNAVANDTDSFDDAMVDAQEENTVEVPFP